MKRIPEIGDIWERPAGIPGHFLIIAKEMDESYNMHRLTCLNLKDGTRYYPLILNVTSHWKYIG